MWLMDDFCDGSLGMMNDEDLNITRESLTPELWGPPWSPRCWQKWGRPATVGSQLWWSQVPLGEFHWASSVRVDPLTRDPFRLKLNHLTTAWILIINLLVVNNYQGPFSLIYCEGSWDDLWSFRRGSSRFQHAVPLKWSQGWWNRNAGRWLVILWSIHFVLIVEQYHCSALSTMKLNTIVKQFLSILVNNELLAPLLTIGVTRSFFERVGTGGVLHKICYPSMVLRGIRATSEKAAAGDEVMAWWISHC